MPKAEKDRWAKLMENYFATEGIVTLGIMIVDARHKPTADDVTMAAWFKSTGSDFVVVANKVDKVKKSQIPGKYGQYTSYPSDNRRGRGYTVFCRDRRRAG